MIYFSKYLLLIIYYWRSFNQQNVIVFNIVFIHVQYTFLFLLVLVTNHTNNKILKIIPSPLISKHLTILNKYCIFLFSFVFTVKEIFKN